MEAEKPEKAFESVPMAGGDGPNSYSKNSSLQRRVIDDTKGLLSKAIAENLENKMVLPSKSFRIADLGCSTGPNTFQAVENIIEAVNIKYQSEGCEIPEFQVFFQDLTANDFNILFQSLPQNRQYYAAGVPGSFYGRLFPKASIHFAHCSTSIHWLSRVPEKVVESNIPLWNKGRIHYSNVTTELLRAYETQHKEDMSSFLKARAQEIVPSGLLVLILPGRHDDTSLSDAFMNAPINLLRSSLMDLVKKGLVSEEKVDSFNLPVYAISKKEVSDAVERNGCFSIEMVTRLPVSLTENTSSMPKVFAIHVRAAFQGVLMQHFGDELMDELFDLYLNKCEEHISTLVACKPINFFVVLKRKKDYLNSKKIIDLELGDSKT